MSTRPRRPTSADVAALAGVSRATVSMVLNGRTEGTVAPATQQRVRDAAAELGYTRSALAISLKERRSRTIGLITDEIATSPFAGRMVRAASLVAAEAGYLVITVDLSLRDHTVEDAARMLAERQVDGLLYATMGRVRVPRPTTPPGIPLVLLNCELDGDSALPGGGVTGAGGTGGVAAGAAGADGAASGAAGADGAASGAAGADGAGEVGAAPLTAIVPDDEGGARRAARRLAETGHRRIAMLSGGDGSLAVRSREAGFRAELAEHGIVPEIVPAGWQIDDGYRATARLLSREDRPTGLFCIRDRVAGGALHAAAAAGLDVPRDLSVIGFDDEDFFAERVVPPLTTIALPHEEMGRRAMAELLVLLGDLDPDAGVTTTGATTSGATTSGATASGAATDDRAPETPGADGVLRVLCPLVERESVGSAPDA